MSIRNPGCNDERATELWICLWGVMDLSHTHAPLKWDCQWQYSTPQGVTICMCVSTFVGVPTAMPCTPLSLRGTSPDPGPACPKPTGSEGATAPPSDRTDSDLRRCRQLQCRMNEGCRLVHTCVWHPLNCRCPAFSTRLQFNAISSSHNLAMRENPDCLFSWSEEERRHIISRNMLVNL